MKQFAKIFFSVAFTLLLAPILGNEAAAFCGVATLAASNVPQVKGILGMNTISARMVYENAKRAFDRAGVSVAADAMAQSFLRFELALSTTKTQYAFQVTNQQNNGATAFNTEQRLNLQDSFVISHMGIFLGKAGSSTDTTFELDTYGNVTKYTNGAAMNSIFTSGILQITVNNKVLLPAWDANRHFYRPQSQQTAATNPYLDQKRLAEDGLYAVEPNVTLIGSKNNQIVLNLPVALSAVDASSRVILVVRGILAQNSTVVS